MAELAQAEARTDRNPSLPQIAAGNYKKGKYRIHGLVVSIENPRGSVRSAKDGSWKVRMPTAYGYILGTEGADSQHIDCFLGPHHRSPLVYVINQKDAKTGKWDEHKCFIGFASPKQVRRTYESAFSDGRAKDRIGGMHELTVNQFKEWLERGDTTRPMKRRANGGRIFRADGGQASDPNDLSDQYNTSLPPKDEAAFQQWATANPKLGNTYDYDARGFWQNGAGTADNGHGSDQWKKPNHPTFSTQSQYSGADGNSGGQWNVRSDGTWSFVPSATNLKYSDSDDLRDYFATVEPDNRLVLPSEPRADGGRIGMADGGAPSWDDTAPVIPLDQQPTFAPDSPVRNIFDQFDGSTSAPKRNYFDRFDVPPFDPRKPFEAAPEPSGIQSAVRGIGQGLSFGFNDELRAIDEAGGAKPGEPGSLINTGIGAYKYWTGDKEAEKTYNEAIARERAKDEAYKKAHPYMYGTGEAAGAIPAMAVLPEAGIVRGTGIGSRLARGAVTGAEYGGLSGAGEGEDLGQRIENAGSGVLGGGAAGFAGTGAGEILNAAGQRFIRPVVNTVRGWMNPEAEAARRVATALQRDGEMIAAGTAKGLTPQQWMAARNAGEPVTLADLGAGNTQALLRSAANTSPEGRAMLEQVIEDRFLNQGERVATDVRNLVAGGANANKTADQLVADYEAGRAPLYRKAFTRPDAQSMYDDTLEQISQAPVVQQAVRMANITAKNEAAKLGFTPMRQSPFAFDESGRMTLRNPDVTPNLQYWDAVKKNLDQLGPDGQAWSRTLRDHLDSIVPEYKDARGFAANFFGERDALDAGRKLAGKRVDPETIKQAMRQMSPQEQDLFREGYASDWANRVIGNMSETRDVTKAMFNSPNERARAAAVFGPGGMEKIQARMTLETIMDGARRAMGNSTTARQLIEAGLAGGALGGYEAYRTGFDPVKTFEAAGVGAGARLGAGKLIGSEMAAGARYLIGRVDAKTARNVAELLTSDDPARLKRGFGIAMRNQKIMDGLKRVANTVSLSALAPSGREAGIAAAPAIQNMVGARAASPGDNRGVPAFDPSQPFERREEPPGNAMAWR